MSLFVPSRNLLAEDGAELARLYTADAIRLARHGSLRASALALWHANFYHELSQRPAVNVARAGACRVHLDDGEEPMFIG